jgi:hypothetical protein
MQTGKALHTLRFVRPEPDSSDGTVQSVGGLGRHRQLLRWFAPRIEQMAKSGCERAIVDRATNLKNGISATP